MAFDTFAIGESFAFICTRQTSDMSYY